MSWTDFFIKRPVLSISLTFFIVFIGIFSYFQLSLRLFPKIDNSLVTVSIDYPGASAQTVQSFISNTVEGVLSGLEGVDYITSSSNQGNSSINLYLDVGTNADAVVTNVMQKVAGVRSQLPDAIKEPVISKADVDDSPVLLLAFTSKQLTRPQITDYLTRVVKPQLEAVAGVAEAQVLGPTYAMRLWLNPKEMARLHVSMMDIHNALISQNIQSATGSLDGHTKLDIRLSSELLNVQQFNDIVVKQDGNSITRIRDIGKAELGSDNYITKAFYNGKPAVMVFITQQLGANPLTIVKGVKKILPVIAHDLPSSMQLHTVVNAATFIQASMTEVVKTLIEAIIIVAIIVFLFIGNLRGVVIPLVAIPVSLIGTCFFLLLLGYSINLLTLLALVIAIGLVVDDAIVVMENIHRYIENGHSTLQAALVGTREIAFSIIAMTLTLAIIFAPIAFSSGLTGKLFSEFAFSLSFAVILSGVVALTLSPMMCSKIMHRQTQAGRFERLIDNIFTYVKRGYSSGLNHVFKYKKTVLLFWLLSIIGCIYFYQTTPQELAPKEDRGYMQVIANAPDSTGSDYLAQNSAKLPKVYATIPEIKSAIYVNNIPAEHQVISFIHLLPWSERDLSNLAIQPILQARLNAAIPGLQSVAIVPPSLPGSSGLPVQFVLQYPGDYKALYEAAEKLMSLARKSGLFLFVTSNLNYDQPELDLKINRKAAQANQVSVADIASVLGTAINGDILQYFDYEGRSYGVIPQLYKKDRGNPEKLNKLYVRNQKGDMIPITALVSWKVQTIPASLNQFQKFNAVTISGVTRPGVTLSQGLYFLETKAKNTLPSSFHYDYAGASRQYIQEGSTMLWLFLSAFIAIFLLLSMQFESFKSPLIILLGSLPMALFSAILPLKLGFGTVNIYTQIGLLTLAGLISKHGILLVKFANELSKKKAIRDAVFEAATVRLRPILMTTLAVVFGILPLVLSTGAGSGARFALGIVILSGMVLGTLCTLFVLPVLYCYITEAFTLKKFKR